MTIPNDKVYHFALSALITLAACPLLGVAAGVALALLIGAAKEQYDSMQPLNRWDWLDFLADAVGVAFGAGLFYLFR